MSTKTFLLYLATWSLVALTPGPAVMSSMAQSVRCGFRSSRAGICGIQAGNFLFFVCVALGLGTLLETTRGAFSTLRLIGAVYLLYLGLRIIAASFRHRPVETTPLPMSPSGIRGLFLQGLFIQLTNPKALLFVSALLPQFIDPLRPVPLQLVILVITTIAVDSVVLSSYAFLAQHGAQSFRRSSLRAWFERAFGVALVFFGCRLLFARK